VSKDANAAPELFEPVIVGGAATAPVADIAISPLTAVLKEIPVDATNDLN
jgi:hypothetical protein